MCSLGIILSNFVKVKTTCFHHADPKSLSAVFSKPLHHPTLAPGFDLFAASLSLASLCCFSISEQPFLPWRDVFHFSQSSLSGEQSQLADSPSVSPYFIPRHTDFVDTLSSFTSDKKDGHLEVRPWACLYHCDLSVLLYRKKQEVCFVFTDFI